ncbi:Vi polysaccharide biosynthesis UDP-N-acetylglucosamine C-6 dehydrogenase TviB [Wenzhouxiangella sp. XN24]|uniref:Vi polysaccharide biosynthesis UDP-N-acetylglucosamine C-6 dehydrogenase TviB n=1 Tax=Wenzhouxiangella sp. XN24 TaxID=2713569 RepID=UPI0013ECF2DE|nr:Vi polysaccharide biosynthesis UDP-N-acetylglucosamine C-6 dehydrogenase TviB [Wenzhouxiangella sp. XN24]NGX17000.1 Vi polysaccharide biosynthesis UDP-N-acetylglucosamine C-6 dehydrogenase TviB [Wenzhouxiangella sp. XN24]
MPTMDEVKIGIIGLGYVGLPLAVAFGRRFATVGFDLKAERIAELESGRDSTLETSPEELASAVHLGFTAEPDGLAGCNVYIVTVPTPIDSAKIPDLSPLRSASRTLGQLVKPGDTVIFESTVYPGATEEVCIPIIEKLTGLEYNKDFFAGYSPERINPGDKEHRVENILKVTSGSTPEVADFVDALYGSVITAGTYKASSIRVAEAAKVIENTQRDVNIALINELAMIFNRLGIDTLEVLEAAGTKWNFLPFRPGLVGGHCIGVDPYYLTHKSQEIGYHPAMILAGRRLNDNMAIYVANRIIRLMIKAGQTVRGSRILVLGLTFKENCPDIRNTKVVDMVRELEDVGARVDICDPWVDADEARHEYGIELAAEPQHGAYDAVVLAVAHDQFRALGAAGVRGYGRADAVVYDIKHVLPADAVDGRL